MNALPPWEKATFRQIAAPVVKASVAETLGEDGETLMNGSLKVIAEAEKDGKE